MKIAVIGANGQLGCDVCKAFTEAGDEVIQLNHDTTDIASLESIKKSVETIKPQIVVNTAAMHNVDACEANPLKAFEVNGIGARNLAILANELDFTLFHISTDYVFDGLKNSPYLETDTPRPLNVYGNTKLSGEYFIQTMTKKYFVLRVAGLYGTNPCRAKGGNNFVKNMLRLAKERGEVRVTDDEITTPTFTEDIAKQIVALKNCEKYGLYHSTAQGQCSWYVFAAKIFEISGTKVKLWKAGPNEFPAKVPRPKYSVLANAGLKKIGLDIMPRWEEGLKRYIKEI
jgi:dTDP-4-dehydrorhamnose reductase